MRSASQASLLGFFAGSGNMRANWLALISGAIFPLAHAPFYWWPFGLLSFIGFILALCSSTSASSAFRRSWIFGFGQFSVGVSWVYVSMHDFGGTPMFLAIPMVGVFAVFLALVPAILFAFWKKYFSYTFPVLTLGVFWFLSEWVRSWLFTGFPWLYAGDAHVDSWLSGWAPIIGSYGISVILFYSAAAILALAGKKFWPALLAVILWPSGWLLGNHDWTDVHGTIQVSAVQGNINQNDKWKPEMIGPTIHRYVSETEELWNSDLVVWPETAITLLYNRFLPYMEEIGAEAREHNTAIVTGIPYQYPKGSELSGEFHNSVTAFGAAEGLYHKQRLVPFGEFIPLEKQLRGLIPFFDLEMSSFLPGKTNQEMLKAEAGEQLYEIAPFICYEIAYPDLVRHMARSADLLITISNDAWFGDSLGPKQHMALAQMRALETGRFLLRATNTGITALVDHKGRFVERMETGVQGHLTGSAELRSGSTPYMMLGVYPHLLLTILILGASLWKRLSSQRRL